MSDWLIPLLVIVVLAIAVLVCIYLWSADKSLVQLNDRVDEAWSDITGQLQRQAELMPQLIESVKGYAPHEKAVFENVTQARAATLAADGPAAASAAESRVQLSLRPVFTVAESYPQLQSSQTFLGLQQSIVDTQDKIQASRRFYNGGVREFNTKISAFPSSMFAKRRGYAEREFFEVDSASAMSEPPRVQF